MYKAIYKSNTTTLNGCIKQFATTMRPVANFQTVVDRFCNLCHKEHSFRLMNFYFVTSENLSRQFDAMLRDSNIESEVDLP